MHDPMTVAFNINWPFTRTTLITIWHVDPEKNGHEDSCGWFMRAWHGDQNVLEKIVGDFTFQWSHGVPCGWFADNGEPNYSAQAIALAMFRVAANNVFGHWGKRAENFLRDNLFNILHFAENSCDSLYTSIHQTYGGEGKKEDRVRRFACVVYSWILNKSRPWWRHPRYHWYHWRIQLHPWQKLRRWLWSRCHYCGKGFKWDDGVVGLCWDSPRPRWFESFRGEREIAHHDCSCRHMNSVTRETK